jgi:hypothetical protein
MNLAFSAQPIVFEKITIEILNMRMAPQWMVAGEKAFGDPMKRLVMRLFSHLKRLLFAGPHWPEMVDRPAPNVLAGLLSEPRVNRQAERVLFPGRELPGLRGWFGSSVFLLASIGRSRWPASLFA